MWNEDWVRDEPEVPVWHRRGVAWFDARGGHWWRRWCKAQTLVVVGENLVQRCTCGRVNAGDGSGWYTP